jgi:hypothetical protein
VAIANGLSMPARTQFDCLHAAYLPGFHGKWQQSADEVPSVVAAGAVFPLLHIRVIFMTSR